MKPLIITLALIALASPAFAQVRPAHTLVIRDSVYNISSIKSTYREKISKWNALRLKRGKQHVIFELTDNSYPLDVVKSDVPSKVLKDIPDPRTMDEKHPVMTKAVSLGVNLLCTGVGLFVK